MNERKIILSKRFAIIFLIGALSIQCGSFQGVSYYDSDGIYNSRVSDTRTAPNRPARQPISQQEEKTAPQVQGKGSYYENYFQNLSDEYASTPPSNDVFVDVDGYSSPQTSSQPWGAQPNKTEVYLINTRPLNPYFYGGGWAWNRFDPWRFNYPWGGFNSWGFGANPYWGWAGFNSFYSPFWGGFYDPFMPNRFYSPYAYRSRYFRNYNNRFGGGFTYGNRQRYSRVSSYRGEKSYRGNRDNRNRNRQLVNSDKKEIKNKETSSKEKSRVRVNVGRNLYSIGLGRIPANLGRARRNGNFQEVIRPSINSSPTKPSVSGRRIQAPRITSKSSNESRYSRGERTVRTNRNDSKRTNSYRNQRSNNTSRSYTAPNRSYDTSRSYSPPSRSFSSPRPSSSGRSGGGRSGGGRSGGGRSGGGRTNN